MTIGSSGGATAGEDNLGRSDGAQASDEDGMGEGDDTSLYKTAMTVLRCLTENKGGCHFPSIVTIRSRGVTKAMRVYRIHFFFCVRIQQ